MITLALVLLANTMNKTPHTSANTPADIVENPNQYFYGHVLSGDVFEYDKHTYTALEVRPVEESKMYDQQLTLCGDQTENFTNIATDSLVVIVFSKSTQNMCFRLRRVDVVEKFREGNPKLTPRKEPQ